MAADQRQQTDISRTVRRVNGYWQRAGVPRRVRRLRAEELRAHLLEAVDDHRTPEDVVGDDVAAFAAEWADAERSRPLLDLALQLVAALTLVPGGAALLHPLLASLFGQQDPRIGLPGPTLAVLTAIVPAVFVWGLVRLRRHRLTTQQAALAGVALGIAYMAVFFLARAWWGEDRFYVIAPAAAWALVVVGTPCLALSWWLKRSRWR